MESGEERIESTSTGNICESPAEAEAVFQEAAQKLQAICEDKKKSSAELASEIEKEEKGAQDSSWIEISPIGSCKESPYQENVQSYQIPLVDRSMNQSLNYPPPPPPSPGFALKDSHASGQVVTSTAQPSVCSPRADDVSKPDDDCVNTDCEGLEIVPVKCLRTDSGTEEPAKPTSAATDPTPPGETSAAVQSLQPEATAVPPVQYLPQPQPQVPVPQYQPAVASQPIIVAQQTSDSQQQQQQQQQQQSFDPAWYAWMHGMNKGPRNARYLVVSVVLLILSCFNPVVLLCGIPAFICALASLGEDELDTTYSMGMPMPRENRLAQTLNTGSLVCSIIGITSCCLLTTSVVILVLFLSGIGLL